MERDQTWKERQQKAQKAHKNDFNALNLFLLARQPFIKIVIINLKYYTIYKLI